MRKLVAVLLSGLLAGVITAGPAAAQSRKDWETCFSSADLDARLAACNKVIARAGRKVPARLRAGAYFSRGYVYNERRQHDLAIRDLDASIGLDSTSANAFNSRGLALLNRGEYDRAISDLDKANRLDPKSAAALVNRASAFAHKNEYDLTIRDCDAALRLDPTNAVALALRGLALTSKGELDRAVRDLDEAIRLGPKDAGSWVFRASVHAQKADYGRALQDLDAALRLDPTNVTAFNNRGGVFLLKGEYDRAIRDYDEAIRLGPADAKWLTNRGGAFTRKGDFDRASRDFDEAIRLNPRYANAFSTRGENFRRMGDLDRALIDLDEGLRLDPTLAPAYTSRGLVFEAKGDLTRAQDDFKAALAAPDKYFLDRAWAVDTARAHLAAIEAGVPAGRTRPVSVATAPRTPSAETDDKVGAPAVRPAPMTVGMPPVAGTGIRVALVIGNGAYRHSTTLANPANDAADMARSLRGLGFDVVEGRDLGKHEMEAKLREFGEKLDRADLALFFYAGHGLQVADKNYLVPIDARLGRAGDLVLDTITIDDVLAQMESARRVNLVFLDACRDNPLARSLASTLGARSTSVGTGLAPIQSAVGTMIVYATQPKNVALDGDGRNSPFTAALLKHIATPGLEVAALMKRVRADVYQATRERQLPWDHSSLIGDVVLAR